MQLQPNQQQEYLGIPCLSHRIRNLSHKVWFSRSIFAIKVSNEFWSINDSLNCPRASYLVILLLRIFPLHWASDLEWGSVDQMVSHYGPSVSVLSTPEAILPLPRSQTASIRLKWGTCLSTTDFLLGEMIDKLTFNKINLQINCVVFTFAYWMVCVIARSQLFRNCSPHQIVSAWKAMFAVSRTLFDIYVPSIQVLMRNIN